MAKADSSSMAARAPRGTKPVSLAFFAALDSIPEASRGAVAKAAQVMIRDELKLRREKVKIAAAKEKARKPVVAKTPNKPAAMKAKRVAKAGSAAAKRRSRKPSDVPVAA